MQVHLVGTTNHSSVPALRSRFFGTRSVLRRVLSFNPPVVSPATTEVRTSKSHSTQSGRSHMPRFWWTLSTGFYLRRLLPLGRQLVNSSLPRRCADWITLFSTPVIPELAQELLRRTSFFGSGSRALYSIQWAIKLEVTLLVLTDLPELD